jgi:hypothetical protein
MTRTEVTCLFCGGRIRSHWELIFLHASCTPPVEEEPAAEIPERPAPPRPPCDDTVPQFHAGLRRQQEVISGMNRHYRRALDTKKVRAVMKNWFQPE